MFMLQKSFKLIDADGSLGFVSAGQVSNVNCFSLIFNVQSQGPNVRSRNYAKVLFFYEGPQSFPSGRSARGHLLVAEFSVQGVTVQDGGKKIPTQPLPIRFNTLTIQCQR